LIGFQSYCNADDSVQFRRDVRGGGVADQPAVEGGGQGQDEGGGAGRELVPNRIVIAFVAELRL